MSFKNHMEISQCQLPDILAVYIVLNLNNVSSKKKKRHKLSFFLLSNMESVVKIFSTMLYVVLLHNNVDLKYLLTVLPMIFLHDSYLATN